MSRVEWTRYGGDDIEHVVAMLLCREYPNAERIRPSSGDGGIDVRVPVETGFDIYPVKKFAQNLEASEKGQIAKSLNRLVAYVTETGLPVVQWHLAMPLDPTPENTEWFVEITKNVDYPCFWKGLAFIDGLAAKYPEIIDYYLRDGRGRLEQAQRELAKAMSMYSAANSNAPLTAGESSGGLVAVFHTINRLDPFYRYEFDVAATLRPILADPAMVFATTVGSEGAYVTFRVYARFKEAVNERPVTVGLAIPTTDPAIVQALDNFSRYGTAFTSPPVATIEADLPGGLGGSFENAVVRLGSTGDAPEYQLRFQAIQPGGHVLASTIVNMHGPFTGPSGRGVRAVGTDAGGCFTVEILTDLDTQRLRLSVTPGELAGRTPTAVLDGIRVLDQMGSPNQLRIAPLAGPVDSIAPLPPFDAPTNPAGRRLVEALAVIQEHTMVQVSIPPDPELTAELVSSIDRAARLLSGEEITVNLNSAEIGLTSVSKSDVTDGPMAITFAQPLTVSLNGENIELGATQVYVPAAQVTLALDGDGGARLHLSPIKGKPLQMVERMISVADQRPA